MDEVWLMKNLPEGWTYDCTFHPVPAFLIRSQTGQTLTIPLSHLRNPSEIESIPEVTEEQFSRLVDDRD